MECCPHVSVRVGSAGYSPAHGSIHISTAVIAMEMAHESNYGPWIRLSEKTGAPLKVWKADPAKVCGNVVAELFVVRGQL